MVKLDLKNRVPLTLAIIADVLAFGTLAAELFCR